MALLGIDLSNLSADERNFLISFLASLGVEVVKSAGSFTKKKVIGNVKKLWNKVLDREGLSEGFIKELEKEEVKEKVGELLYTEIEKFIDEKLKDDEDLKDNLNKLENYLKDEFEKFIIKGEGNKSININISNNKLENNSQINLNINQN